MKCMIPEISWHNREPVLCVDIQPVSNEFYRLATGGSDCHVLIWQANILENGAVNVDIIADLTRHQRAVNAVRWSPDGQYLASADDDANIIIWNLKTDSIPLLEGETNDKETWIVTKVLRGHKEDVYDICWSPNGLKLLSGSVDNTAIIWDFTKGKIETILSDHKAFVQGVTWDPKGQYIATLSSDRLCRVFECGTRQVKARIGKGLLPVPESHPLHNKEVKYFHDDTFKSYFRRLQFSPDGNLLIAPCGCVETDECKKALNATFIFTLDSLTRPVAILPLAKQCSIVVRCCPILFELRPDGPDPVINLPYRMIIAVATDSDIILYDTQQASPFAYFQKIHYTRLTDLAWSVDGLLLMASSTDGFCTLVTFDVSELGTRYTKEDSETEESVLNVSGCEELGNDEVESVETKPRKSNFLVQWAQPKIACDISLKETVKTAEGKGEETVKTVEKKEIKATEEKTKTRNLGENIINTEPIEIIDISSPVKKSEMIPKRIIPTRVIDVGNKRRSKTNSSVKPIAVRRKPRISEANDVKASPLLNFLKSNKASAKPKSSTGASKSANVRDSPAITTILDETEARDAWQCENKTHLEKIVINQLDESTEDIPDFKLQLEESTLTSHKVDKDEEIILIDESMDGDASTAKLGKENRNLKCSTKAKDTEPSSQCMDVRREKFPTSSTAKVDEHAEENMEVDDTDGSVRLAVRHNSKSVSGNAEENASHNLGVTGKSDCIEKENKIDLKDNSQKESTEDANAVKNITKKTVRRIPLITLSSPKTKKQKTDT